jgi:diguanylate cyclase (GGDEF)-like protein
MILATALLKFARRAGHPLCLLYIDMDSLKSINDTFGHAAGDMALSHFANILTDTFRDSDVISRMGGDEFVVLTVDTKESAISSIQTRLQSNVNAHNLQSARDYSLSFSLGIIPVDLDSTITLEELLAQADEAMYQHKQNRKRTTQH